MSQQSVLIDIYFLRILKSNDGYFLAQYSSSVLFFIYLTPNT
jgi:hypothetical protein